MNFNQLLRLLRPHQYTKNLLVFAAPGAAGMLDESDVLVRTILAFVLFCLVSSAGYVGNDLVDAEADRMHPSKQHRPIASGAISRRSAAIVGIGLLVVAFVIAPVLGAAFTIVLAAYALLTAVYTNALKRTPWLELVAVSSGFVLRAVGGAVAADVALSSWFLVVVSAGALLLIAGKRLGELVALGSASGSRQVLAHYSTEALRLFSAVAAGFAIGGYSAWAAAEASERADGSLSATLLRLTAVPFIVAIGRYLSLSWHGGGEMPERVVVRDPIIVGAGVVWLATYAAGIYS